MISFLLQSIATDLQTHFTTNDSEVDVMPSGNPKPGCGKRFISIYGGSVSNPDPLTSPPRLRMAYEVLVTITVRNTTTPIHRQKNRYAIASDSLMTTAMAVAKRLNGNYTGIMAGAKTLLDASTVGGSYTGSIVFRSMDANPQVVGPEWFYADEGSVNDSGLAITMQFGTVRWTAT